MKNSLHFTMNEQGFYLPFVLITVAITLITLTTIVNVYMTDTKLTNTIIEQHTVETLIQMGRETFKEEESVTNDKISGYLAYQFPSGDVDIEYKLLQNKQVKLDFTIIIKQKTIHKVTHFLNYHELSNAPLKEKIVTEPLFE